ncbi:MAG: hypothetical protein J7559_19705, partial [Cohnella sp.]|nr:hypothetical protein [Cohnella sp.]
MKRIISFCLAVILWVSFVPVQALAAASGEGGFNDYERNLIDNGTFEAIPEEPDSIVAWETETGSSENEAEVVYSEVQPNNHVLKIHAANGGAAKVYQWIDLASKQQFKLTADVFF